jgi:predicted Rossmann-fold nucleotide-binding protein
MVEEGFLKPENRDLLIVADNIEELLDKMLAFERKESKLELKNIQQEK